MGFCEACMTVCTNPRVLVYPFAIVVLALSTAVLGYTAVDLTPTYTADQVRALNGTLPYSCLMSHSGRDDGMCLYTYVSGAVTIAASIIVLILHVLSFSLKLLEPTYTFNITVGGCMFLYWLAAGCVYEIEVPGADGVQLPAYFQRHQVLNIAWALCTMWGVLAVVEFVFRCCCGPRKKYEKAEKAEKSDNRGGTQLASQGI